MNDTEQNYIVKIIIDPIINKINRDSMSYLVRSSSERLAINRAKKYHNNKYSIKGWECREDFTRQKQV